MVTCLGGGSGGLTAGVLLAPLLVARGLGRRAAHWLVLHNQRRLQKLSLRRNRRKSGGMTVTDTDSDALLSNLIKAPARVESGQNLSF